MQAKPVDGGISVGDARSGEQSIRLRSTGSVPEVVFFDTDGSPLVGCLTADPAQGVTLDATLSAFITADTRVRLRSTTATVEVADDLVSLQSNGTGPTVSITDSVVKAEGGELQAADGTGALPGTRSSTT
ncbi:MAG TPA: hypothetical protein VHL52_02020 [Acidimicrobiia bacterium]|nr:hypothetical protein [Acidimicrobiia bacterium]